MEKVSGLGIDFPDSVARTYTSAKFKLAKTNPAHIDPNETPAETPPGSFRELLMGAIDKGSDIINKPQQLTTQAIIDPESVNMADIPIASRQAEITVRTMTSVVNRALEAYRAIIALR